MVSALKVGDTVVTQSGFMVRSRALWAIKRCCSRSQKARMCGF